MRAKLWTDEDQRMADRAAGRSLSEWVKLLGLRPISGNRDGTTDPVDKAYARDVAALVRDLEVHLQKLERYQVRRVILRDISKYEETLD